MRVLKKYANRRLYDTENSCYITLDDVHDMVLQFQKIKVVEASSGNDITDQILLQIIANQENNKSHKQLFTQNLLEQLIRVYSYDNSANFSQFLERSLSYFLDPVNSSANSVDMWLTIGQKQFQAWQQMFTAPTRGDQPNNSDDTTPDSKL